MQYGEESEESIHLIAQNNHVVMIRTQRRQALNHPLLLRGNSFADRMNFPVSPIIAQNEETRMTPGNGFASRYILNTTGDHLSSHPSNDFSFQLRNRDQLYTGSPCNNSLPSNHDDHRRQLPGTRSSYKWNVELPAVYNSSGNQAIRQFPDCLGKPSALEGAPENSNVSRVGVEGAIASDPEIITLSSDSEPNNDAFGNSSSTAAALPSREIKEPRATVSSTDPVNLDASCEATSSDVASSPPRASSSAAAVHACRDTADEEPKEGAKKKGVTTEEIAENKEKQGEEERGVEDNCSKEDEKRKESEEILNCDKRSEESKEQTGANHGNNEEDEDDDDDEEMDEKERNEEGDEDYFSNDSTSDITIMASDRMSFGASDSCHVSVHSSSYVEELNEDETCSWRSSILLDRGNDHEGPSNDLDNVDDEDEESPRIDAKTAGRFSKEDGAFIATEEKVSERERDAGSGPNGKEESDVENDASGEELSENLEGGSIENVSDDEGVSDESVMADNVDHIEKNQLNNNSNEKLRHPSKYSASSKKCEISQLNEKGQFLGTSSKSTDEGQARIFGSHGSSDFRGFADFRDGSPFDRTSYSCDLSYRGDEEDLDDVAKVGGTAGTRKSAEHPVAPVERGCTVLVGLFAAMTLHERREDLSPKRKREEEVEFQNMWKKLKISADCEAKATKTSSRRSRRRQFRLCGLPVDRKTIEEISSIGRTRSETRSLVSFDATEKNAPNCDGTKEIFESIVQHRTKQIPKEASSGASLRKRSANIDSPIVGPPTNCDAPREAYVVKRKRNHSRTSSGEDSKDREDSGTVPNGTTKKRSIIRKLNDTGIMFMKRAEIMVARGRADREKHIEGFNDNSLKARKISPPNSESTGEIYGGMTASEKKKETRGDSSSLVASGASASNGKFIDEIEMAATVRSTPERISNLRAASNVSSLEESMEGKIEKTVSKCQTASNIAPRDASANGEKAEVFSGAKTKETPDFEIDSELEVFKGFDKRVEFGRSKARSTCDEVDEASTELAMEDIPNFQKNSVISPSKSLTSCENVETPLGVDTGNFPDCGTVTGSQELEDPVKRNGLRDEVINDKKVGESNLQRILKTSSSKKSMNGQKYNSVIKVVVEKLADPWTRMPAPKIMSTHEERSQGKVNSRRKVASKKNPSEKIVPLRRSPRISEMIKSRGMDGASLPCVYKGRD